jgi:hypothetical protein
VPLAIGGRLPPEAPLRIWHGAESQRILWNDMGFVEGARTLGREFRWRDARFGAVAASRIWHQRGGHWLEYRGYLADGSRLRGVAVDELQKR